MRIHDYMKIIEKLPLGKPKLRKKEEPTESEKLQAELEPIDESDDSKNPLETKT